MVVPLGPGKFYGSSLPRPRFHKDGADRVCPPVPVLDPLLSWANEAHWSMGGLSFQRLRLQGRIEGSIQKLRAERERSVRAMAKISKAKSKASDLKPSKPPVDDGGRKRAGSVSPPPAPVAAKRRRYVALVDDSEEEDEEDEAERKGEESEVREEKKRPARKLYEEFDRVAKESEKAKGKGSDAASPRTPRTRAKRGGGGIGDEVMRVVEDVNREVVEEGIGKKKKMQKKSGGEGVKRVSPRSAKGVETSPGGATAIRTSPRLAKRG
ncbi:uncharacterized protein LOC104440761 [Eucalyptus grandis]|uniref:Uncharacterized protein n=3 Tax=Eucalyptus TaxID=3932 RepID=A0ACC3M596_EUCGR|nr:uncharacterized protein LOC104440761 [Eucalyptus grandis]KAK3446065.1 hypothetical protein EUGRSUZ_A01822 [Eucalyptus grandis]